LQQLLNKPARFNRKLKLPRLNPRSDSDNRPFNPLLFRLYASDLSEAVYKFSQENQMNIRLRELAENRKHMTPLPERPSIAPTEKSRMSITGLQGGAFQAKLAEMRQRIADSQKNSLAHIDGVVAAGSAKLEEAAKNAAAKAQSEIDDALQEFATFTNGGE
jgi:hypothetical protein